MCISVPHSTQIISQHESMRQVETIDGDWCTTHSFSSITLWRRLDSSTKFLALFSCNGSTAMSALPVSDEECVFGAEEPDSPSFFLIAIRLLNSIFFNTPPIYTHTHTVDHTWTDLPAAVRLHCYL